MASREQKAREVIAALARLANEGKRVTFTEDWGGNSLTVEIDDAHTHVGFHDSTDGELVDGLHRLFVKGSGLSFHEDGTTK